ncbi:putative ubiquitin-like-specific protease 2B [Apium graveolens]|uniref:putative ubiquitin-like-specific protease 2B n=1 Tax=Apium graveolens TaxID=4045 RepID=UPI003D79DC66
MAMQDIYIYIGAVHIAAAMLHCGSTHLPCHWNLLILCNLGETIESKNSPCNLLLDSLHAREPHLLKRQLQSYVDNILKYEEKEEIDEVMMYPFEIPRVPQQNDGSKCGHYVLHYIYKFLMTCPDYYNYEEDYPGFMNESWFTADEVNEFSANLPSWHETMLKKKRREE